MEGKSFLFRCGSWLRRGCNEGVGEKE